MSEKTPNDAGRQQSDRALADHLTSEGFDYWVNTDEIVAEVRKQGWGPLPEREHLARLLDPAAWRMGVKNAIASSLNQADAVRQAAGLSREAGQS